jgi:tetratricopeptide (TPR) repeat protein
MKDFARAKTYLEKQTKRESKRVLSYLMLGQIHYEEEDYATAEKVLRQAVEAQHSSAAAHFNLALILEKQGKFGEAIEHLRKAKATDPFSLGNALSLIKLHGYLGQSSEQYELVRVLLGLRPDSAEFSYIKANGGQNLSSAMQGYLDTFVSGNASPPSEKIRAIIAALREDYPEAIEHYNRYLQSVSDPEERGRIEKELDRLETILDGRVPLVVPL